MRKVLTVKELIDVLSAIENKDLEVYVRGSTWWIVPCNQVIEDGDSLVLASYMEFNKERVDELFNVYNEYQQYKNSLQTPTKEKIEFKVKTGAQDRVFGSVSAKQIEKKLNDMGYSVDKKNIIIDSALSSLGTHIISIALHKKVIAKVKINLVK